MSVNRVFSVSPPSMFVCEGRGTQNVSFFIRVFIIPIPNLSVDFPSSPLAAHPGPSSSSQQALLRTAGRGRGATGSRRVEGGSSGDRRREIPQELLGLNNCFGFYRLPKIARVSFNTGFPKQTRAQLGGETEPPP